MSKAKTMGADSVGAPKADRTGSPKTDRAGAPKTDRTGSPKADRAGTRNPQAEFISQTDNPNPHAFTLYGKADVIKKLSMMKKSGRTPHTVIFSGEEGTGKETCAKFFAALLICENPSDGAPCGVCRQCLRVAAGIHPDVITPARTGKSQIYTRDTMREVTADCYIKPNDTDRKIYIFPDFENTDIGSQNLLLKVVEEPPGGAVFIFTVTDTAKILPTILSRAVTVNVFPAAENEAKRFLTENTDFDENSVKKALSVFHGNIGECLSYLESGCEIPEVNRAIKAVYALIKGNEYDFNAALNEPSDTTESRARLRKILGLTEKIIRDAVIFCETNTTDFVGCYPEGAKNLAAKFSVRRLIAILESITETAGKLAYNTNTALAAAALAADIF
jgi:DNA polymerase-3 subunit delta'